MAASSLYTMFLFLSIIFSLFFSPSFAAVVAPPSAQVPSTAACNATLDPKFCSSVLPPNQRKNLYDYSRFSLAKSLSDAWKFSRLIDVYLARHSALPPAAVKALQDCQLLSELNVDFLSAAGATLNSTTTLMERQTDTLQTLLSAILTNQQTCSDGIQAAAASQSVTGGLAAPLFNGTKLYSMSLALFTKAWVKNRGGFSHHGHFNPGKRVPTPIDGSRRRLLFHEADLNGDAGLPLRMPSDRSRELFESRTGRRLQQASDEVIVSDIVIVNQDGTGNFTNITSAVSSAPSNADGTTGYYLIYVVAGVYQEYVSIPKNKRYLMMIGDGINQTVITGNHSVGDGWTTFNSATLAVVGQGFVAINLTITNTAGAIKNQAVALRNGADLSTFYSCSFDGFQDTLYTHSMRQLYRECDIYGTVDFIFGNAAVVFQDCNIYSRLPIPGQSNTITAQGRTDPNQNTGTSIQGCKLEAAGDLAADGGSTQTYLGRPWKQYSRTVVMESFLDGLINPAGWLPWNGNFALSTLYYAEYDNTGPAADTSQRVTWPGIHYINATDAGNFTASSFLLADNWLPQAGVPYSSGLV